MKRVITLISATLLASGAHAATTGIVIPPGSYTVPGTSTTVGDNTGERGGGGYTEVTTTAPHAAPGTVGSNGSLEIHGDRSRYVAGNIYEYTAPGVKSPSLLTFDDLDSFAFDWRVNTPGSAQAHAAPAVRLHIMDGDTRAELIWEYVYNGGTSGVNPPLNTWSTAPSTALYYANIRDNDGAAFLASNPGQGLSIEGSPSGQGVVYRNGGQFNNTLADWKNYFSSAAYITGFSFGAGSGFGSNFVGFVDNVRAGVGGNTYVANFEAGVAAVPEPATWISMILGLGAVGGAMRRRRTASTAAFA